MNNLKTQIAQISLSLLPLLAFFIFKNSIPEKLPIHYNASMEVDRFGGKNDLLVLILILFAISLLLSVILNNITKIDPKKKLDENSDLTKKISWLSIIFLASIAFIAIYEALSYNVSESYHFGPKLIPISLSIFLILLGNLLNSLKQNYFIGIRTPWALEDNENWRITHNIGAKSLFFGGILMLLLVIFLPIKLASFAVLICISLAALVPIVYSYLLYRRKKDVLKH